MNDVNMPATEAGREPVAYELAYHVLPTVAEGEVTAVTDEIKAFIQKEGGVVTSEEAAERFELAYEIEKYLEGKHRRFSSAYFGWVRFTLLPTKLPTLTTEVEAHKLVLRSLTIRLTKAEEQHPFRFHEAIAELKNKNITIDTDEEVVKEGEGEVVDVPEEVVVKDDELAAEVVK